MAVPTDQSASLMSMREAAAWLRLEGADPARWLRRHLLDREQQLGRALMVRVGRNSKRPRYRVSVGTLRKYVPELIDPQPEMERAIRSLVVEIKREHRAVLELLEDIQFQQVVILGALRSKRSR